MNLVAGARRNASLVVLATVSALAFGAVSLVQLPSGIYPDVDFSRVVVVAHVGDLPPALVQAAATRPLEEAIVTVPGMRRLRSRTIRGAVELSADFVPGTDMWRALQLVESGIADVRAGLPDGATVVAERVSPTALPLVTFNVSGAADSRALRDVAERILRPAITRVPGVGLVEVQGGDAREIEVLLRPADLAAAHLTPSAVADCLAAADLVAAVGRVHEAHQVLTVVVDAEAATTAAIAALPIGQGAAGPIPLASVADVVEGAEDRTVTVSGPAGECAVVAVSRALGASAPTVVDGARLAVDALARSGALPAGVRVDTVYDQSVLIRDAMSGVRDAILIGIALSLLVLVLFLRDLRAGIAAAVAVPVTLVATFGVMRLLGQTLNLMSLGGLAVAIGLVIDDAIVIVEAIVRRAEEGLPIGEAAERGTSDLLAAVVGTTVTTVVVFAPLALLSGVVGAFFGALATTLAVAVLLSLVVSVTLVPLLAALLLRPRPRPAGVAALAPGRVVRAYGGAVRRVVRHPFLGLLAVAVLAGGGVLAGRAVPTGFLPEMDEGAFVLDFFLPPGTSLEETDRISRQIDGVLAGDPRVVTFTRRTGTEMGPATATLQNSGDILVRLVPRSRRPPIDEVIDDIRERVGARAPEARIEFVQVLQDVLGDLEGNPRPIEVKIFGPDPAVLAVHAARAAALLDDDADLLDLDPGLSGDVPILSAAVDRVAAGALGVAPADIAADLDVAVAGRLAATVRLPDRVLGVRVRLPDRIRLDAAALAALPIAYGVGAVPLGAVVAFTRPVGPSVLLRENLRPVVVLSADVAGADLGGASREVTRRLTALDLGVGYNLEIAGQAEEASRTRANLAGVFGIAVALVLVVLLVQLRSLALAFAVLLGAPLALVGALVTLLLTGVPLNASSLMGCVLLAGLVVKNGILLFEHAQRDAAETGDLAAALARAGERRLRPILMTTAATLAGLAPLALNLGAGAELQRPLAVATIGGLVLLTLVTLFALPALARLFLGRTTKGIETAVG